VEVHFADGALPVGRIKEVAPLFSPVRSVEVDVKDRLFPPSVTVGHLGCYSSTA